MIGKLKQYIRSKRSTYKRVKAEEEVQSYNMNYLEQSGG